MMDAGKIMPFFRGNYEQNTTYEELDVVLYEMCLWIALQGTTGNAPPGIPENADFSAPIKNEYWTLFLPGSISNEYVKKTDIAKPPTDTTPGKLGVFFPDGKTLQIDEETGELTGTPISFDGTWKELKDGLESGEVTEGMVGYVTDEGGDDEPDADHPYNMLFDFDNFISKFSSNAPQNRAVAAALDQIKTLIEQNQQLIEETQALRSSLTEFGLGKICPTSVTDVTEDNGLVLGAKEKNPSVAGTLANQVKKNTDAFAWKTAYSNVLADEVTGLLEYVGNGTKEFLVNAKLNNYFDFSFVMRGDTYWIERRYVYFSASEKAYITLNTWNNVQQLYVEATEGISADSTIKFSIYYR